MSMALLILSCWLIFSSVLKVETRKRLQTFASSESCHIIRVTRQVVGFDDGADESEDLSAVNVIVFLAPAIKLSILIRQSHHRSFQNR